MNNSITLSLSTVRRISVRALIQNGFSSEVARRIFRDLLTSEHEGYPSHGLIRIIDYTNAIRNGWIKPTSVPKSTRLKFNRGIVVGNDCAGVLCADAIVKLMKKLLRHEAIAVVGFRESGHIGRLSHIADPLCRAGYVVLGFVNYRGAGRHVLIPSIDLPRLATNPIVIGLPNGHKPIIFDFSTSMASEGKIRKSYMSGLHLPDYFLIDHKHKSVTDPSTFYKSPSNAFLAPLGTPSAPHKGFGLAVAVEVLAGIIAGGGHVEKGKTHEGNAGLFIGISPTLLDTTISDYMQEMKNLLSYLHIDHTLRPKSRERSKNKRNLRLSRDLWVKIEKLAA